MNRRGFMAGILASGFAPAIAGSGVLMPIKPILEDRMTATMVRQQMDDYLTANEHFYADALAKFHADILNFGSGTLLLDAVYPGVTVLSDKFHGISTDCFGR